MSEYIVNLLPLKEGEREEFEAIAPGAVHVLAKSSTVTAEQLAQATIMFGWPRPERMREAVRLKWFQTMWAGTEEYDGMLPEGVLFTSSSGSNSRSVAEHMLTCLLAVCRRLPAYMDSQRARLWHFGRYRPGGGGGPCGERFRQAVSGSGGQNHRPEADGQRPCGGL